MITRDANIKELEKVTRSVYKKIEHATNILLEVEASLRDILAFLLEEE